MHRSSSYFWGEQDNSPLDNCPPENYPPINSPWDNSPRQSLTRQLPGQFPSFTNSPNQLSPPIKMSPTRQVNYVNCQTLFQRLLFLFTTLILGAVVVTFSLIYKREWTIPWRTVSSVINVHAFLLERTITRNKFYVKYTFFPQIESTPNCRK